MFHPDKLHGFAGISLRFEGLISLFQQFTRIHALPK
jgi:hypothetical protein